MIDNDACLVDEPGRICALNRLGVLDTAPERQFDRITELVRAVLDVPIAAVSLVDAERQWFKSMQGLDCTETPRDLAFCHYTIQGRQPMNVGDARIDPRFAGNPLVTSAPHIRAYLGAPLQTPDGYNVGALCAIDRRERAFSPAQERMLANFAALVVDELELRHLALRDSLTGALNRRAFLERAEGCRTSYAGAGSSLVMLDIDHFKSINDCHGHPAGDAVLKAVAHACREAVGANHAFGRIGGEEFAMLLPGQNMARAIEAAERMRETIAALDFTQIPGLKVTASFGVVDLEASSVDAAMTLADTALYVAKRQGRNRCISSSALAAA